MKTSSENTTGGKKRRGKLLPIGIFLCLCLAAGAFLLFNNPFQGESPQLAIQALLEERASALSRKDLERYLRCFSPHYQDGGKGYSELKANASRWFSQFESIQFSFQTLRLEIDDIQALVENNYTFTLRPPNGENLEISNKELLELRREDSDWKIFSNLKPQ